MSGINRSKAYIETQLCGHTEYQPDNVNFGKNTIVYVDLDKHGKSVDFAVLAVESRNNRPLSGKVRLNKQRLESVYSEQRIASTEVVAHTD